MSFFRMPVMSKKQFIEQYFIQNSIEGLPRREERERKLILDEENNSEYSKLRDSLEYSRNTIRLLERQKERLIIDEGYERRSIINQEFLMYERLPHSRIGSLIEMENYDRQCIVRRRFGQMGLMLGMMRGKRKIEILG